MSARPPALLMPCIVVVDTCDGFFLTSNSGAMSTATNSPTPALTGPPVNARFTSEAARVVDEFFLFNETPGAVQCLTEVFAHYASHPPAPMGAETRTQCDAAHLDAVQHRMAIYFDILNLVTALGNAHSTYAVCIGEKEGGDEQ